MIPIPDHPSTDDLVSMFAGELPGEQAERLFEHLSVCERCQARSERIWEQASPLRNTAPDEMDDATSFKIEQCLRTRLHRVDLAENIVGFGSHGFVFVMLRLLQPIVRLLSALAPQRVRRR